MRNSNFITQEQLGVHLWNLAVLSICLIEHRMQNTEKISLKQQEVLKNEISKSVQHIGFWTFQVFLIIALILGLRTAFKTGLYNLWDTRNISGCVARLQVLSVCCN